MESILSTINRNVTFPLFLRLNRKLW